MNRMSLPIAVAFSGSTLLLIDSTIKAALLLAVAGLVALILRRDSAATRHLVWLVAIVAMLAVPVFSSMLPQWRVLPAWAVVGDQADEGNGTDGIYAKYGTYESHQSHSSHMSYAARAISLELDDAGTTPRTSNAEITAAGADQPVASAAPGSTPWTWQIAVPVVWAAGFIILILRLIAARIVLWKTECGATIISCDDRLRPLQRPLVTNSTACECRPAEVDPIVAAFDVACLQLQIRRRITVLIHPAKTIPVVWGILRYRLLLPALARQWSSDQLRSVLLHELSHIKRRDTLAQFLAQMACALHWFNPLVWFAAWRLHVERERSCDDMVLASGVRPSAYADHLLQVATKLSVAPWTAACGLAMARKSSLEGRLVAVLSDRLNRRSVTTAIATVGLLLGVGIAVPLAMLRAADADEQKTDAPALNAEPKDAVSKALFETWKSSARSDGKIPGALIGHVANTLDDFVKQYPANEATPKFVALRSKFDKSHDWEQADVVALLDEVTAISTAPVSWADTPMESSEMWTVQHGTPLPIELKSAAWGEPAPNGLRAAWLLQPRAEQYPLGSVLKA